MHTKLQTYKHTSSTPLRSYQQSKTSLTFQLNTTYHHRLALSAVIYTHKLKGGGREDHGEPICVYGFAGKEINDLPFLFGFNEVGIEGLPCIPSSLPACPLPPPSSRCHPPPPLTHRLSQCLWPTCRTVDKGHRLEEKPTSLSVDVKCEVEWTRCQAETC